MMRFDVTVLQECIHRVPVMSLRNITRLKSLSPRIFKRYTFSLTLLNTHKNFHNIFTRIANYLNHIQLYTVYKHVWQFFMYAVQTIYFRYKLLVHLVFTR